MNVDLQVLVSFKKIYFVERSHSLWEFKNQFILLIFKISKLAAVDL